MVITLLAAVAAFLAVMFLALWVARPAGSLSDARIRTLMPSGRSSLLAEIPFSQRILLPAAEGMARRVVALLPHTFVARIDRKLIEAGRPITTQAFFTIVATLGLLLPITLLVLVAAGTGGVTSIALFAVLSMAAVGALLPFLWLSRRARARRLAIWKSLPNALDLITTCVEAGLGLDAAFQRVAEKLKGPFAEEVSRTLGEVGMGRPRRQALEDLARRSGVPDLSAFVNAVIQAQQLGTNLGKVLRAQAHQMRVKRRQRAEQEARRMPIKMVFPLVFCTIPALFIVTLGPVALTLVREFSD